MGQQVVTLMYGIRSNTKGLCVGEEGDFFWEQYTEGVSAEKRLRYDDERCPRSAYEGEVVGFSVASGPGQNDDEGYLGDTIPITAVATAHGKHIRAAKKRWDAFAAWAKKEHGKTLPKAVLWLTTDERA